MTIIADQEAEQLPGAPRTRAVYLDGFSTTPLLPEAQQAMVEIWRQPANPASPHALGERAADCIDLARRQVATLVGCAPTELTFTSGATEANNLSILGGAARAKRRRILVSAIEHKSVLEPASSLRALGFEVGIVPVDRRGVIDLAALSRMLDDDCWLVAVMAVNNETGVIQPVEEVVQEARRVGALVHCDAVQAIGKISLDLVAWDVDYATFSAHKIGGPTGVGALYVSAGCPQPAALQLGGGQQGGRRPGTEPAALIAGFGAAAAVKRNELPMREVVCSALLDRFLITLQEQGVAWESTTADAAVVPGGRSMALRSLNADDLCVRLAASVFLSTGSACTAGQLTTSHVLNAMGLADGEARSVVRIMIDRWATEDDVTWAAEQIAAAAQAQIAAGRSVQ